MYDSAAASASGETRAEAFANSSRAVAAADKANDGEEGGREAILGRIGDVASLSATDA